MKPVVFADTIGWLNEAVGKRGVVIAGAHGHEDLCSRRFLRLLSDRAAAAGLPALLFDYPGCGNAAGDHSTTGQVESWIASIGAAIDRLKRDSGVADVVLVGFRLGALLAPLAAAGRNDVAGLALLAPPASGKAYVREMTVMSRMIDAPLVSGETGFAEGREVAGFRLSDETLADLAALDRRQSIAALPSLPMLVATNGKPLMVAEIRGDGAGEVSVTAFQDYHLLMCDPTANRIPVAMLERCAGWLSTLSIAGAGGTTLGNGRREALCGPHYIEEPVAIGPAPLICGVLCRPLGRTGAADPVILLNAGGVPHVGWARGTVEAARELAAAGVASLRIDLSGLGLSGDPQEERLFLYDMRAGADIIRAIDWMEKAGFPSVGLVGTCSGAFQAFHAARADRRVCRLTMINPLCFAWNSSYALELAVWKAYGTSRAGMGRNRQADGAEGTAAETDWGWKSLAARGARALVRRALEAVKSALSLLNPASLSGRGRVERWMRDLCGRGVPVLMVTSEGDLSLEEIARHFGPDGARLAAMPGVTRVMLPNADHTLTSHHARRTVIARLIEHGGGRGGAARRGAARATAKPSLLAS